MANNLFIPYIQIKNNSIQLFNIILTNFSKCNLHFSCSKSNCKELTVFGTNLSSTIGYPYYTKKIRQMIDIPDSIMKPLIGILLSDGNITVNNNSKYKENARFRFKQSMKHIEYIYLVFCLMRHYCSSYPYFVKTRINRKDFYGIEIVSRALPCFLKLRNKFYLKGKKIVPIDLYDILTYEGLAHWIMGDGSFVKGGGLYLHTQSFTIEECVFIMNVLCVKFELHTTLHMQRNKPVIYFRVRSVKKLYPYIDKYIIKGMHYKFDYKLMMKEEYNGE